MDARPGQEVAGGREQLIGRKGGESGMNGSAEGGFSFGLKGKKRGGVLNRSDQP